jgi:cytochrome c553
MISAIAVALLVLGVGPVGATALTGAAGLVAEGEHHWSTSPEPGNPVACATCHHDPGETLGWAASFPKYRALPPPDGRVMTLLQANAEAVRRHYGRRDPERVAVAITAYLTWRGAGVPVAPGIVAGQPVFETRLHALSASVARGERVYARRCGACHAAATVARVTARFPRVVDGRGQSLEGFIAGHRPGQPSLAWDSPPIADVIAFLMSHLVGRPVGGSPRTAGVPSMPGYRR